MRAGPPGPVQGRRGVRGARTRAVIAASGGLLALQLLSACDLFEAVGRRLAILGVDFSFQSLDVGRLIYPDNWLSVAGDLLLRDRSSYKNYGVDVRCAVRAANPNREAAVFDGALAHLRIEDTALSDPDVQTTLPAFTVGPGRDTVLDVVFPLRLDDPVFSLEVWRKVVRGEDIPYRVDADLRFSLVARTGYGTLDTLGARTLPVTLLRSSVDARAESGPAVRRFLEVLDVVF